MLFLIDENSPPMLADVLQSRGHEAKLVKFAALSASDDSLARLAQDERRIMVTRDLGFGDRFVRKGELPDGVVLVRCPGLDKAAWTARVLEVIDAAGESLFGTLTLVGPDRVRPRPFGAQIR